MPISIPDGSIKRREVGVGLVRFLSFQFQMVRLKGLAVFRQEPPQANFNSRWFD